uniref:ATP synthase subunit gamma, mitochondrial n=1 Tax=Phaeomonas parva TaxID=124430 RepID=A0A7S1UJC2_9STRA|mmetsp:Transcript_8273/g.23623  ORF Transcript_8273/g.23623 Transcript_8273/m.23623 type:complete len:300 (+) Transcript_8273:76-975(+)|eukprot:CAMPEP_0118867742 /NCGR_PEP_ID=MMETSP1163-20130328/11233_1 /TAXON_ID=124430 /ORGANISM="Phaeomonas parva, Strain CCMP2877" /LENGTH=299 /DNA_ID=CAMNT_0006802185 /DNA_START=69 /DNA_END=968 /DNA_ORIENTATION=-
MQAAARALGRRASRTGVRGMATEKQLRLQITATQNLAKITQSMKMVSASKLRGDQTRLDIAKPFGAWTTRLSSEAPMMEEIEDVSDFPDKNLFICLTSDKGLCGGVNSVITRNMRSLCALLDKEGKEYQILVFGDKGRAQLRRLFADNMLACITESEAPHNFATAAALSQVASKDSYDAVHLVYNEFVSAIAYNTRLATVAPMLKEDVAEPMPEYEFEPDNKNEVMVDLFEYMLTTKIYYGLMEGATSEQSSRMNAMENASKNAGELIDKLTLQYNRARQARITTELIEIISGASALEG